MICSQIMLFYGAVPGGMYKLFRACGMIGRYVQRLWTVPQRCCVIALRAMLV